MSEIRVSENIRTNRHKNVRYLEIVTGVYVFVMLVIFPFLMDGNLFYKMTRAKFIWFVSLTSLYIVATIFALGMTYLDEKNAAFRKSDGRLKLTAAQAVVIIYMLWGIASAINSDFGSDVLLGQGRYEGLYSLLLYGISFVLVSFWGEYSDIIPKGLAAFGILQGILVAVQLSGLPIPAGLSYFGTGGFIGTFGNIDCMGGIVALTVPAMFAAYVVIEWEKRWIMLLAIYSMMCIEGYIWVDSGLVGLIVSLTIALPFLLGDKNRMQRTATAFAVLFAGIATGAMFIRNGDSVSFMFGKKALVLIVFAAISAAYAVALLRVRELKIERRKVRNIAATALIAIVTLGLIAIYMYKGEVRLLKEASEVLHGEMSDEAGSGRGIIWKYCLELIPTLPLIGTGPGTFYGAFAEYNKMLADAGSTTYFDFAHNDFLQIAICLGVIGLVIYLIFVATLAFNTFKNAETFPIILIFAAGCAGYLVHSFFSFSIAIMTPGFWVMAGLLDNISRNEAKH